jgi:hypothetical protein
MDAERFIKNLQTDEKGHVVLNMFDNSILHDSFLQSCVRCGSPGNEPKPKNVRFVKNMNPWGGITYFTDKMLDMAPAVDSTIKVAWIIEPGDLISGLHNNVVKYQEYFDFIFTYEQNLLDINPDKYKFLHSDAPCIGWHNHKIHKKSKLVSMVFSNKMWLPGHKLRHHIAKEIFNLTGYDKLDLFGTGSDRPLKYKADGTNDYMFQIAIENMQRPNYFADKIFDCFVTGTVPIYWGCSNIGDFFDIRGILCFNSLIELSEILPSLSKDKYVAMLPYIEKNYQLVQNYLSPDDIIFEKTKEHLVERFST